MRQNRAKWVFFSALPPFRGGISKFSAVTLNALENSVELKAFTFKKQYPDLLFPGSSQYDFELQDVGAQRVVSTFNPFTYLFAALRFRKEQPDVFVSSYWMTFMAPMMIFWTWLLPRRTIKIAIIHNLIPHEKRFYDTWLNRRFLLAYDAFVVLSTAVKKEVLALKPDAKIILLPHPPYALDTPRLSKEQACAALNLDPDKKTLLFFGLIRSYKGLMELISAFEILGPDYQLLIAGEVYGDAAAYHHKLQLLSNPNWRFDQRFIPEEEVATYFQASDLVVLPYLSATQSGVRALALSQQCPVLCTNVGGLAEGLEASNQGFELLETDPINFSKRIQSLFNQGDIQKCKTHLSQSNLNIEQAWRDFAAGLIEIAQNT